MTDLRAVAREALDALEQAGDRLRSTHTKVVDLFPLTVEVFAALDEAQRERLDAYAVRYARYQDLVYPALRALGRLTREPKADRSFLELHAVMEKAGVADSIETWDRQRALRNAVGHAYPQADRIVDILNGISASLPQILAYPERIRVRVGHLF